MPIQDTCTKTDHLKCPDCRMDKLLYAMGLSSSLELVTLVKGRMETLMKHPEQLSQDVFGVCGTTSIIYLWLKHDSEKFPQIFTAAFGSLLFGSDKFSFKAATKDKVKIDVSKFANHFAKARPEDPNSKCLVDYVVSRALAQVLKAVDPTEYKRNKIDFSVGLWGHAKNSGALSIDVACMQAILVKVAGMKSVELIDPSNPAAWTKVVNASAQFTPNGKKFALAACWGDPFQDKGPLLDPLDKTTYYPALKKEMDKGRPFNHWIVLDDKITVSGTASALPFWTWAERRTLSIEMAHIASYMPHVILGELP